MSTPHPSTSLSSTAPASEVGVVLIGRNEGERLGLALEALVGRGWPVVYVDSGSSDGSAELARVRGAMVLELDAALAFTAARARNEGFAALTRLAPGVSFVQFVDGDSVLVEGWIEQACSALRADRTLVAVAGHCRERHPDASVFNRLCALEWKARPGEVEATGGIVMIRAESLRVAGGFDADLIAGEEPELCDRLRRAGGRILLLDRVMCLHDSAMRHVGQWWNRCVRAGHAYAEAGSGTGGASQRRWARQRRSALFWGACLPLATVALVPVTGGASLALVAAYPCLAVKIAVQRAARYDDNLGEAALYATFCVLAKLPEASGLALYWLNRARGDRTRLIEHKPPGRVPTGHDRAQGEGHGALFEASRGPGRPS